VRLPRAGVCVRASGANVWPWPYCLPVVVDEAARSALFARPVRAAPPRPESAGPAPTALRAAQSDGGNNGGASTTAAAAAAPGAGGGRGTDSKKLFALGTDLFRPKTDLFKRKPAAATAAAGPGAAALQRSGSGTLALGRRAGGDDDAGAPATPLDKDDVARCVWCTRTLTCARELT
jgi:hypothetical protein